LASALLSELPKGVVQRHSPALRIAHWIVVALVFVTWPLGLMIGFVKDQVKLDFYMVHESIGFLVLWFMLLRLGIRLSGGAVEVDAPRAEKLAASTVHGLLYAFLIIMPVSGFLATNAHGFPLQWFWLIPIWSPIGKSPEIAPILSSIHFWSAWTLLALVALHIAAALFHHIIRRDATLYRIL